MSLQDKMRRKPAEKSMCPTIAPFRAVTCGYLSLTTEKGRFAANLSPHLPEISWKHTGWTVIPSRPICYHTACVLLSNLSIKTPFQ